MKRFLIISLFIIHTITPTYASSKTTYLLYGDMPVMILLQVDTDEQITVLSFPVSLVLKTACTKQSASLQTLTEDTTKACLINTVSNAFDMPINHTLYLHTGKIDQDFPQYLNGRDLENMDRISSYFNILSSQVNISLLWSYQKYVTTDLSIWELKDLFPLFTSDQLDIQYLFPHLIGDGEHWYILDKRLYK